MILACRCGVTVDVFRALNIDTNEHRVLYHAFPGDPNLCDHLGHEDEFDVDLLGYNCRKTCTATVA